MFSTTFFSFWFIARLYLWLYISRTKLFRGLVFLLMRISSLYCTDFHQGTSQYDIFHIFFLFQMLSLGYFRCSMKLWLNKGVVNQWNQGSAHKQPWFVVVNLVSILSVFSLLSHPVAIPSYLTQMIAKPYCITNWLATGHWPCRTDKA